MESMKSQANLGQVLSFLKPIITRQSPKGAWDWLDYKLKQILSSETDALYFMTFSAVSQYFGKSHLTTTEEEVKKANTLRKDWRIDRWSLTQTARTYLLLSFAEKYPERFNETLDKIIGAADMFELIAIYQAMSLFPNPDRYSLHATNGIRSNMISVFDAIALNNPYPADYFNDLAWKQVVLKTLFVDSRIEQVIGIKRRAHQDLGTALCNTVEERFAAHRPIKLEMWSILGLCADSDMVRKLKGFLEHKDPILQQGALIACDSSTLPEAKALMHQHEALQKDIQTELNAMRAFQASLV
jgi:hypothetical protein